MRLSDRDVLHLLHEPRPAYAHSLEPWNIRVVLMEDVSDRMRQVLLDSHTWDEAAPAAGGAASGGGAGGGGGGAGGGGRMARAPFDDSALRRSRRGVAHERPKRQSIPGAESQEGMQRRQQAPFSRRNVDAGLGAISELMWGSVPLSQKESTMKIHVLSNDMSSISNMPSSLSSSASSASSKAGAGASAAGSAGGAGSSAVFGSSVNGTHAAETGCPSFLVTRRFNVLTHELGLEDEAPESPSWRSLFEESRGPAYLDSKSSRGTEAHFDEAEYPFPKMRRASGLGDAFSMTTTRAQDSAKPAEGCSSGAWAPRTLSGLDTAGAKSDWKPLVLDPARLVAGDDLGQSGGLMLSKTPKKRSPSFALGVVIKSPYRGKHQRLFHEIGHIIADGCLHLQRVIERRILHLLSSSSSLDPAEAHNLDNVPKEKLHNLYRSCVSFETMNADLHLRSSVAEFTARIVSSFQAPAIRALPFNSPELRDWLTEFRWAFTKYNTKEYQFIISVLMTQMLSTQESFQLVLCGPNHELNNRLAFALKLFAVPASSIDDVLQPTELTLVSNIQRRQTPTRPATPHHHRTSRGWDIPQSDTPRQSAETSLPGSHIDDAGPNGVHEHASFNSRSSSFYLSAFMSSLRSMTLGSDHHRSPHPDGIPPSHVPSSEDESAEELFPATGAGVGANAAVELDIGSKFDEETGTIKVDNVGRKTADTEFVPSYNFLQHHGTFKTAVGYVGRYNPGFSVQITDAYDVLESDIVRHLTEAHVHHLVTPHAHERVTLRVLVAELHDSFLVKQFSLRHVGSRVAVTEDILSEIDDTRMNELREAITMPDWDALFRMAERSATLNSRAYL